MSTWTLSQDKWVKNRPYMALTQPETDVLAKGLNFAVTPDEMLVIDHITATENPFHAKASKTVIQERRVLATLGKDKYIKDSGQRKVHCRLNTRLRFQNDQLEICKDDGTTTKLEKRPSH